VRPMRLSELAAEYGGTLEGDSDPEITGVAGIEDAGPGDLSFLARQSLLEKLEQTKATAVVLGPGIETKLPVLRVADAYVSFASILGHFSFPQENIFPPGIHPTAVVADSANIDPTVAIGPYSVIGECVKIGIGCCLGSHVVVEANAVLGEDCFIHSNVMVGWGNVLGNRVIVHAGTTIGTDGFGYLPGTQRLVKIPQIGHVVIEDDVEIGASVCIDRATIGQHCALSAQTGISGSCTLGNRVTMGGQVGVGDHLKVGSNAKIAGKTGVTRDVPNGQVVFGYPGFEFKEAYRMIAALRKTPSMIKQLSRLEKAVERLQHMEEK